MPYDPSLPQPGTAVDADQMRGQFHGLKDLIDAVSGVTSAVVDAVNTLPPGSPAAVTVSVSGTVLHLSFDLPQGGDGAPGPPFTNFLVDGVNTLNPGDNATVSASFDGTAVRLLFGIPRGVPGDIGPQGIQGPQGPPFANAVVDGVTTLNPGDAAFVNTSFDGSNVRFAFGIPRGRNGNDGGPGPQGAPGEVTLAQLNSTIQGTSSNSNAVAALGLTVSDPPTQAEAITTKLDELINALRR